MPEPHAMPLDLLDNHTAAVTVREIIDDGHHLSMLEIADGVADVIGPTTTHAEVEDIARCLLNACSKRGNLPITVHKLCLAYLSLAGQRRVA
jgi:hypothetical protein